MTVLSNLRVARLSQLGEADGLRVAEQIEQLTSDSDGVAPSDPRDATDDTIVALLGDRVLGSMSFKTTILVEPLVLDRQLTDTQMMLVLLSLLRFLEGLLSSNPALRDFMFMTPENAAPGWSKILEKQSGVRDLGNGPVNLYEMALGVNGSMSPQATPEEVSSGT